MNQPVVDSRWLWAVRIPTLVATLVLGGLVLWSLLNPNSGLESALPFVPYLAALGCALWCLRGNPPERFGVALAAGLGLLMSIALAGAAMYGLVWLLPALLAVGYTISAAKVFTLLKQEDGDVWRLVGAFFLAIAVFLASATLFPRDDVRHGNQVSAIASLRTINRAQATYASTYKHGYSANLAELGPATPGANPTASAAGLIDKDLAAGGKDGYGFIYAPGSRDAKGGIANYTLTARPFRYTRKARRSFYTDETGAIRVTEEDRSATPQDLSLPD